MHRAPSGCSMLSTSMWMYKSELPQAVQIAPTSARPIDAFGQAPLWPLDTPHVDVDVVHVDCCFYRGREPLARSRRSPPALALAALAHSSRSSRGVPSSRRRFAPLQLPVRSTSPALETFVISLREETRALFSSPTSHQQLPSTPLSLVAPVVVFVLFIGFWKESVS